MNQQDEGNDFENNIFKPENYYIPYANIAKHLKRYSFDEKMRITQKYSRMTIDCSGNLKKDEINRLVYPWELETFLMLAISTYPEYKKGNFIDRNEKYFIKMINGIREYQSPKLEKYKGSLDFVEYFMTATGLTLFDIQEDKIYKLFLYSFIFNFSNDYIDMKSEFYKFYGTNYQEFISLGLFLTLMYGSNFTFDSNLLDCLIGNLYKKAASTLVIDVEQFKRELDIIATNVEDYITCLRPSYKYPFIKKSSTIYLPLPHLIQRAITSSLLFRITENNNSLRDKFGKEILEDYLLTILSESKVYDEIHGEKTFKMERHNIAKTLDVMVREGDEYIMLDSKASVPSIGLRVYDELSHVKEINKMVDKIIQIYRHLKWYLPKYPTYNPYKNNPKISPHHLWGISVVLEDSYLMREKIYDEAAKKIGIKKETDEYIWMVTHIKIISLYEIERIALEGKSLSYGLKIQIEKGGPYDFPLSNYDDNEQKEQINETFISFKEELRMNFLETARKLKDAGVLK